MEQQHQPGQNCNIRGQLNRSKIQLWHFIRTFKCNLCCIQVRLMIHPFCHSGKNLIGNIRRAIMRYCNNGNDKYFAKWTAANMDVCKKMFATTHTCHYKPLNKFAPTLPVIHEVDENLAPLKRGMPSYYPPLCLRHLCEMRYTCLVCRGQRSVS